MQKVTFNHYVNEFRTYVSFLKRFLTVYFGEEEKNVATLPHSAQRKHAFLGKFMEKSKKNKLPARKKISLELLHQRLGHISTI